MQADEESVCVYLFSSSLPGSQKTTHPRREVNVNHPGINVMLLYFDFVFIW